MTATELPSGEITLLFTDVEGSTRLWELHGERMLPLLAEHDRIVEQSVRDAGGVLQQNRAEGDSSFAVFADAGAAIRGAVALQRGMTRHGWPADLPIRTRAALHTGSVEVRADTYYGPVVNRCVRLRSLAHGGQTILSRATVEALRAAGGEPAGVALADLGTHRLKDLAVPERVYELRHPEIPAGFPPLRSPDVERHNLPEVLGRFVGRRDEQRSVTKALAVERMVTLVGTGGVGKTRLALEVAWARVHDEATPHDGTWFVNLTGAHSDADVASALAAAVGAREQPGRPLIETISDQLADTAALVLFDNCEHVVTAVRPLVTALLSRCPNLRTVLTSREALGLAGERTRVIAGLPLVDSIELFAERSGLETARTDDEVARLCERLDGIPLAIEIAAARAAELGIAAVERGVADAQLEAAGRSVLEATLTWSHDLLASDEQALFRRLGIFAGQFTLTAAESVVVDEVVDVFDVLDLLDALVQRSLVLRTDEGGYRQLFVVRQYAARLAREAGEYEPLAAAHLVWCVALATALRAPGLDERARFDPLRQVGDDLLAALERPFEGDLAATQVQLAGALEEFWYLRGAFAEGRDHLEAVLARGAGFRSHRAEVHRSAGFLARCQGDLGAATDHFEASLALQREIVGELPDDSPHLPLFEHHLAKTATMLSEVWLLRGDYDHAIALGAEALARPTPAAGSAALVLGLAEHAAGDTTAADAHFAQALGAAEAAGDDAMLADCYRNFGVIARNSGDLASAERHYRAALSIDRRGAREQTLARTLLSLAELTTIKGGDATDLLEEGLTLARALGDRQAEAHGVSTLAERTASRDLDEAAALHRVALRLRQSVGTQGEIALSQTRLAALADLAGDAELAASLARQAVAAFRALGDDRGATEALAVLAATLVRGGDLDAAATSLREALACAARAATAIERADVLDAAALLAAARGLPAEARALLEAADRRRVAVGVATPGPAARLRRLLGADAAQGDPPADEDVLLDIALATTV